MTNEQLRMQMLSGIITEGEYKAMINEDEDIDVQIAALQQQLDTLQKKKQTRQSKGEKTGMKFGPIVISPTGFEKWKKLTLKVYNEDYDEDEAWEYGYEELVDILKKENPDLNKILTNFQKENPHAAGTMYYQEVAKYYGYDDESDFDSDIEFAIMPKIIPNYG